MSAVITALPVEQFGKLREWSIAHMRPLLTDEHRGMTAANRKWLSDQLARLIQQIDARLPGDDWINLVDETADAVIGYGVISPFLRDPSVTEIMVNGQPAFGLTSPRAWSRPGLR